MKLSLRFGTLLALTAILCVGGCKQNKVAEKDDSENLVDQSNPENKQPTQESDLELAKKIGELTNSAKKLESELKFTEAVEAWQEIEVLVNRRFGKDSWQLRNVELAKQVAEKEATFDDSQKRILLSIGELQKNVAQALRNRQFSAAYDSCLDASRLTQTLFGSESHLYGQMQNQLARICMSNKQTGLAISYFQSGYRILSSQMGEVHPEVEATNFAIGQIYQQTNRHHVQVVVMILIIKCVTFRCIICTNFSNHNLLLILLSSKCLTMGVDQW